MGTYVYDQLTEREHFRIRRRVKNGDSVKLVAAAFGVTTRQIYRVLDKGQPRAKLTPDAVRQVRRDLAAGHSIASIARAFEVGRDTIVDIRDGITWKHVA